MQRGALAVVRGDAREAHLHQRFGGQRAGVERRVELGDCRRVDVDGLVRGERRQRDQNGGGERRGARPADDGHGKLLRAEILPDVRDEDGMNWVIG